MRRQGWLAVAVLVAVLTGPVLTGPLPALADPVPDRATGQQKAEPWDPDRPVPPLTVPGTGKTVKPFSNLNPVGPTALPGFEGAEVNALAPDPQQKKELKKVDGAAQADEEYYCQTIMGGTHSVREEMPSPAGPGDIPAQFLTVLYMGEVRCNVWLDYLAGMAGLVDRTPGYDGRTLSAGTPFQYTDWHHGVSTGGVEIPGEATDGARRAEIVFDLIMVAPAKWGNCAPGPGQRILFCSGVGTNTLHVILGLGVFDTGLNPPVARYVALGDSYAAGTGTGNFNVPGPPACRRSYQSYPYLIGGMRIPSGAPINPVSHACHGAVIQDMYVLGNAYPESGQLEYLSTRSTRMVTLSIGGNNLGFSAKVQNCLVYSGCGVGGGQLISLADLQSVQGQLSTLYTQVLQRIRPDGILAVLNYPAIFPRPGDAYSPCLGIAGIDQAEMLQIQQAWIAARDMIASAVRAVGSPRVRLVDVYDAFAGHHVCSPDPWAVGLKPTDLADSFHPNAAGHQAYKNRIVQSLGLRV